jgi:hypothetical protein
MSSGLVGSSIQAGRNGVSSRTQPTAVGTSHTWLASIAMPMSGPTVSRAIASLRLSSATLAPTFTLTCLNPSLTASSQSAASSSSE